MTPFFWVMTNHFEHLLGPKKDSRNRPEAKQQGPGPLRALHTGVDGAGARDHVALQSVHLAGFHSKG